MCAPDEFFEVRYRFKYRKEGRAEGKAESVRLLMKNMKK